MSRDEAEVFGRYVVGSAIDEPVRVRYRRALRDLSYDTDDAITRFAVNRPWSIAALDGGLALTQPSALLRRRLSLMAAILETRPEYSEAFLPRNRSRRDALGVAYAVARAALTGALGLLLLRFIR
ncbi:MAG: hypothetical protein WB615_03920 [Candidatus Tumulicola sp.]